MKKLLSIIIVCFGLFGMLTAQNVWKPMNCHNYFLGADSEGNLFAMGGYRAFFAPKMKARLGRQFSAIICVM